MAPEQRLPVNIEDEMRQSYLDYAMSVIVGRALPDVRDGLKPVHRRILHTMNETGNLPGKAYRKAARIVGDVMGQYHPHGDAAIYDTIVRMVQTFSLRYPLVDGQGNFGSLDGDPAAAYRYTEVRMHRFAEQLLADIDKDTVDWQPNYDESKQEPVVLPSKVPNLLVNGSEGIAVGMATKIPPHNLREVVNALIALIDNPHLQTIELLDYIPGPDFPTGGFIYGRQGIIDAYATGRGKIIVRAKIDTEEKNGREQIVIGELPYQVNKARLVEEIADGVREKRLEGIADLRDESDKDGVRVVLDLKRDANSAVLINQLYMSTNCQTTFGIILLTIVDGQPRILNLLEILQEFVAFRREVVTRRTKFELRKAEERAHILEGLKIALDNLDAVIALIRASATVDVARQGLMSRFGLSERQAQAILDLRLQKLTGLERDKIIEEYNELLALIARLKEILANDALLMQLIKDELVELRDKFGDPRRTVILDDAGELSLEDLIADEQVVVTVSRAGYVKRNAVGEYRAQHRGGKGKIGMETKEEDIVDQVFVADTHDHVLVFTTAGRVYWLKVYQIPPAGRASRGKAIINLLNLQQTGETIAAVLPVKAFLEGQNIVFATRRGVVKRTDLMSYANPRASGIIALLLDEGDQVIGVKLTDGKQDVLLATKLGKAIRFRETDVRKMGRSARGVRGITLAPNDEVVSMEIVRPGASLLTVCEHGYGKRTLEEEYPVKHRGGQGVITIKTTERNGQVVGMLQVTEEDELLIITDAGKLIRLRVGDINVIGRNTQGVRLIDIEESQRVAAADRFVGQALNGDDNGDAPDNGHAPDDEPAPDDESAPDDEPAPENGEA
ncbi:MAG: DNA gyrase subunit A [Myxococcales bacterium]|nr:DNA gyrase subunit A [Myxococcales bacterium]